MSNQDDNALRALAKMVRQYLETNDGYLDHMYMSAGEHAIEVLSEKGFVIKNGRASHWTDLGRKFLDDAYR